MALVLTISLCPIKSIIIIIIKITTKVYLSFHGLGPHHFFVSRADQAPALARLMEEVCHDDNNDDVDVANNNEYFVYVDVDNS